MLQEIIHKLVGENIQIPLAGENVSFWDLMFNPFTRYLGGFFWVMIFGMIAGLIWMRSDSIGPPIVWFTIMNGITGFVALTSGAGANIFLIFTALGLSILFVRAMWGRI